MDPTLKERLSNFLKTIDQIHAQMVEAEKNSYKKEGID